MNTDFQIHETLAKLGLNPQEIQTYLTLTQIGPARASLLAHRLKIDRSTIRYTLNKLIGKRIIFSLDKNKTLYYQVEDPAKILNLLEEDIENIQRQKKDVQKIINPLKHLQNPHASIPKVRYFEGVEGLIDMYEDLLKDCLLYTSPSPRDQRGSRMPSSA